MEHAIASGVKSSFHLLKIATSEQANKTIQWQNRWKSFRSCIQISNVKIED